MFVFVCNFLPPVVAIGLYEKLSRKNLSLKDSIYLYCTNAVLINLISWIILRMRYGIYYFDLYDNGVLIKSLAVAFAAAVALGVLSALLGKCVKVQVEDER